MRTWAFIYKTPGTLPEHHSEFVTPTRKAIMYGGSTLEECCAIAKRLVDEEDCKLIELCGAFGEEGAKAVIEAVDGRAVVGYVNYFPEEREKLSKLPQ